MGWTLRMNGRRTVDKESGCAHSAVKMETRKIETKMGGLDKEALGGNGNGNGMINDSKE